MKLTKVYINNEVARLIPANFFKGNTFEIVELELKLTGKLPNLLVTPWELHFRLKRALDETD